MLQRCAQTRRAPIHLLCHLTDSAVKKLKAPTTKKSGSVCQHLVISTKLFQHILGTNEFPSLSFSR
jgi:hypothetical protein